MRLTLTANITSEEARLLDRILKAAGFENRTDYLTALIHTTLYGMDADTRPPPGNVTDWIGSVRDHAADHDRLLDAAFTVFDEIAFATIAMKGAGYVLAHIGSDLEAAIFERCGLLPAAEDLRTYLRVYQNVRRPQFMQYRTEQVTDEYHRLRGGEAGGNGEDGHRPADCTKNGTIGSRPSLFFRYCLYSPDTRTENTTQPCETSRTSLRTGFTTYVPAETCSRSERG